MAACFRHARLAAGVAALLPPLVVLLGSGLLPAPVVAVRRAMLFIYPVFSSDGNIFENSFASIEVLDSALLIGRRESFPMACLDDLRSSF